MEPSQKATCARPSLAAMPTQVEPTTHSTCAMTRSARPSSLRRLACSAVGVSGMVVGKAYRRFALQRRESDTEIGATSLPVEPDKQFPASGSPENLSSKHVQVVPRECTCISPQNR